MAIVKENTKLNTFVKFLAQGERMVTTEIIDVYGREVQYIKKVNVLCPCHQYGYGRAMVTDMGVASAILSN